MRRRDFCILLLTIYCLAELAICSTHQSYDFNGAFSKIYDTKMWNPKSGPASGPGSNPCRTFPYMVYLQHLISNPLIHKIVEIGFGDFQIMQHLILDGKKYVGFEVVKSILRNSSEHSQYRIISRLADIRERGDLIIVRDVMMHWPSSEIDYFIKSILPRFKYALLTNDYTEGDYQDILPGDFRQINLQKIPSANLVMKIGTKRIQQFENIRYKAYD